MVLRILISAPVASDEFNPMNQRRTSLGNSSLYTCHGQHYQENQKRQDAPSKVPRLEPLRTRTLLLRPRVSICQRAKPGKVPYCHDREHGRDLKSNLGLQRRCRKVEYGARHEDRKVERREVVMQEQLAAHEEEREVMQEVTSKEETTQRVVLDQFG